MNSHCLRCVYVSLRTMSLGQEDCESRCDSGDTGCLFPDLGDGVEALEGVTQIDSLCLKCYDQVGRYPS